MRSGLAPEKKLALGLVPRDPFRGLVLSLMQQRGFAIHEGEADGLLSISQLARLAGVGQRNLSLLITDKRESYPFDFCDALLCALDAPQLWRSDQLREQYEAINLLKADVDDAVDEALEMVSC